MQTTIDESKLKQVFKEVLVETLEERKDVFRDIIVEAIEDVSMINAIKEGEDTEIVSRQEVFSILKG